MGGASGCARPVGAGGCRDGSFHSLCRHQGSGTLASIYNTPQGFGIAVLALLGALRWWYPGDRRACRFWCLHWSEGGGGLRLTHALFPPLRHGGGVLARPGCTHIPGCDESPPRRFILVEGYVAGSFGQGRGTWWG